MATFTIIARCDINRSNGFHIGRGEEYTIHIPMMGITPNNLFGNSRCKDALVRQFHLNGIDLPPTDPALCSKGIWDIQMK